MVSIQMKVMMMAAKRRREMNGDEERPARSIDDRFDHTVVGEGNSPDEAREKAIEHLRYPIGDLKHYARLYVGEVECIEPGLWQVEIKAEYKTVTGQ